MLKVLFNEDGSIKELIVMESINQGSNNVNQIFASILGRAVSTYTCVGEFELPSGDLVELNGSVDTQSVGEEDYNGYTISLAESVTRLAGNLKLNLKLNDLNDNVLCTYQVTLRVNKTGYQPNETFITVAQYNSLVSSLNSYLLKIDFDSTLEDYYTIAQADTLLNLKADKADVYLKTETYSSAEIDSGFVNISGSQQEKSSKLVFTTNPPQLKEGTPISNGRDLTYKDYVDSADSLIQSYLDNHEANKNNPHEVTKSQVGLGNVDNVKQIPYSEKAQANGVATLDSSGQIPLSQIPPSVLGQMEYCGSWDASSSTDQTSRNPRKGDYYICNANGNYNPDGTDTGVDYVVGDWAIYDVEDGQTTGTWDKIDNTDAVSSVNGKTGIVVLDNDDIGLGNVDNVKQYPYASGVNLENTKLDTDSAIANFQPKTLYADLSSIPANSWVEDTTTTPHTWKYTSGNIYSSVGFIENNDVAFATGIDEATTLLLGAYRLLKVEVESTDLTTTIATITLLEQPTSSLNIQVGVIKQYTGGDYLGALLTNDMLESPLSLENGKIKIATDNTPTENSGNLMTSGGIYTALSGKQDELTFDNEPTQNSSNPVTSGGVYTAIKDKLDTITINGNESIGTLQSLYGNTFALKLINSSITYQSDTLTIMSGMLVCDGSIVWLTVDNLALFFGVFGSLQTINEFVASNSTYKQLLLRQYNSSTSTEWDTTPTQDSTKPVTSGGVYSALANKQDKLYKHTIVIGGDTLIVIDNYADAYTNSYFYNNIEDIFKNALKFIISYTTSSNYPVTTITGITQVPNPNTGLGQVGFIGFTATQYTSWQMNTVFENLNSSIIDTVTDY